MKVITTKLLRYKITWFIITLIFAPLFIPLSILETTVSIVLDFTNNLRGKIVYKIVDIFKFEQEAKKQFIINPDKFTMYPIKKAKKEDAFR